jgi:hypothetical protein
MFELQVTNLNSDCYFSDLNNVELRQIQGGYNQELYDAVSAIAKNPNTKMTWGYLDPKDPTKFVWNMVNDGGSGNQITQK